jgi:hypothetical protein
MMILGIFIAIIGAFLVFRFVAGLIKFGLLALVLIVALWFVAGGTHGMGLAGGRF